MSSVSHMYSNRVVVVHSSYSPFVFLQPFIKGLRGFSNVVVSTLTGDLVNDSSRLVLGDWWLNPGQQGMQSGGSLVYYPDFERSAGPMESFTDAFRKPTHTDSYINYKSNHHPATKIATILCLRKRAEDICQGEDLKKELNHHD